MLGRISLASVGLVVGLILGVIGVIAYAKGNATLNLVGFFYGLPLILGGFAFKSSEVTPVGPLVEPTPTILEARETQGTQIQKQLRQDVTKYRYGIKAHLDEVLGKLGLSPTDEERPVLVAFTEELIDGKYTVSLRFESPLISLEVWQGKEERLTRFFGPDIVAMVSQPEEKVIDLRLQRILPEPKTESNAVNQEGVG